MFAAGRGGEGGLCARARKEKAGILSEGKPKFEINFAIEFIKF